MRWRPEEPEAQLLVCCARKRMGPQTEQQCRALLESGVRWERVFTLARAHGMMPLLSHHLLSPARKLVSDEVMDALREYSNANASRNLILTGELIKILHVLEAHAIQAIPFKGPALAACAYEDLSLREFVDLDLLVKRESAERATRILAGMGYRVDAPLFETHREDYLRSRVELPFVREDGSVHVELEWEIVPAYLGFSLSSLNLWENICISENHSPFPSPSPEDTLLLLCVHGFKHLWGRLAWISDIVEYIQIHPGMQWDQLIKKARYTRSLRLLVVALLVARDVIGVDYEEEMDRIIGADRTASNLAGEITSSLFDLSESSPGVFRSHFFQLRAKERPRDRLRFLWQLMVTRTPEDRAAATGLWSPFYPVVRPFRLAAKHVLNQLASRHR